MGGHIDHVYWRNVGNMWTDPEIERYSPYYTDHDASCITLIEQVKILLNIMHSLQIQLFRLTLKARIKTQGRSKTKLRAAFNTDCHI